MDRAQFGNFHIVLALAMSHRSVPHTSLTHIDTHACVLEVIKEENRLQSSHTRK